MLPPEKAKKILVKNIHNALKYAARSGLKKKFIKEIQDNFYGHFIDCTVRNISQYVNPIALEEIKLFVEKELKNGDPEIWLNYQEMFPDEFTRLTILLLDMMTGRYNKKLN